MRRRFPALVAGALAVAALVTPASAAVPASTTTASTSAAAASATQSPADRFAAVVHTITALPYEPGYVPVGLDSAFPTPTPNTAPAEDYTTGSIPGSPDAPAFPPAFRHVLLHSADGAPFYAEVALRTGRHPGIVVAHGFNTNGKESVVRWAAMLAARGYNVIAADQRDFAEEYNAQRGYPRWRQTFGWKEAQDIVAAGRWLAARPGVTNVGIVGFSEGAQNAVLAMARSHVFAAGLTFSGPADQDTQIYSTAAPTNCTGTSCTYPETDALVALVVPPYNYSGPCPVLADAAARYRTSGYGIMERESAMHAQTAISVPLLNFYAQDDPLVGNFQAGMMAGYERGRALQRTIEIQHGAHAYYYDRWWQQRAILSYFKALLPGADGDRSIATTATVNQTPGGTPLSDQLVGLGSPTRRSADMQLAPYICDTSKGKPGLRPTS